jgi:2-keto-3-deoxy-L-arabinonate dehydratase
MKEGNIIGSDKTRAPIGDIHPATRSQLVEMAKRHDPLVLRWA